MHEYFQYVLSAAGGAAERIANLGWAVLIAFMAATLITWVLLVWFSVHRRGTIAEHMPIDAAQPQWMIIVGGFAVPVVVLAGLFVYSEYTMASFPISAKGEHPLVRVIGHQWWFSADYLYPGDPSKEVKVPTEIHIPTGQPVDIDLVTRDVIHSFWVPQLHGKVDLIPGRKNSMRVQIDQPGIYNGECAEFCGEQHAHMRIQVVAQKPEDFQAWLEQQRKPAAMPSDPVAKHGHDLFISSACALCHTIRGTEAKGDIGPDLTHLASRLRIAGGAFKNDRANLTAWVTHAQSLKPGTIMPDITAYNGQDLNALVAYLETLK